MDNIEALHKGMSIVIRQINFNTFGRFFIDGFNVTIKPPKDIDYNDENDYIKFKVTSVGVVTIFHILNNTYSLLLQQADRKGNPWEYPSGGVDEKDFTPEDTALRELQEETGLITIKDQLNALDYKLKPTDPRKGALQYFIELFKLPDTWNIKMIDKEGRIYINTPEGVDSNEIAMMVLEPFDYINTNNSLGVTTHHKWANSVWQPLVNKGYSIIES